MIYKRVTKIYLICLFIGVTYINILGLQILNHIYSPKSSEMKKFCLTAIIVTSLLLSPNNIHSQTTLKGLNQIELFKQFTGVWKGEMGKDTIFTMEIKSFYDGFETYVKTETKGKLVLEEKALMGYDKKSDKYFCARIWKDKPDIILFAFWFTSENTCERIPFEYISNPEQAPIKTIYEFKSPDSVTKTDFEKNKPVKTYTGFRIKK